MTAAMKTCFKCSVDKPVDDFYRHPQMADGRLGKCKECAKRDVSENYAKRRDYYVSYERGRARLVHRVEARKTYSQTPQGKEAMRRARLFYRERYPIKYVAKTMASNAIRAGTLARQPCEVCGEPKSEGHHDDYTKPLEVRWLCKRHHVEWHRSNKAKVAA